MMPQATPALPSLQPDVAQRRASDPSASVWVGASAGSGKTKVLADRVIRLLLSGVRPERILCLTFTRAAAAEMSMRITAQLSTWATCSDDDLRRSLDALQARPPQPDQLDDARRLFARVLNCPGGMRIHTIHAFCQEILRRFPLEAGLSPHFVLLEESDAAALRHAAQSDVLKAAATAPDSPEGRALTALVRDMGEESFTALLQEAVKDLPRLEAMIARAGDLKKIAVQLRTLLGLDPKETERSLRLEASHKMAFAHSDLLQTARLMHDRGTKRYKARSQSMLDWLAKSHTERSAGLESYCKAFLKKDGHPFTDTANKELLQEYPHLDDIISREAIRLASVQERLESLHIAGQTEALLTLASALGKRMAARKAAQAALDYDDLIQRTDALLRRPGLAPWVLFKLDGGIDHILVDEAQDTSPAQWRIVAALTDEFYAGLGAREDRDRTLFVVGDEKQSIYSFLKADPDEFQRMRDTFRKRILAAERAYGEVPLNVSFRSAPAILRAVDAVFADRDTRQGVSHHPVNHEAWHREATGRVEVWPLIPAPPKETNEWALPLAYESGQDPAAELATRVATAIKNWHQNGITVYDRKAAQQRPMTYSDVMILVRKRGAFVEHLIRTLKALDIPVTGADRMILTEQLAVMDLMALVQFTLLPEDDLTLATLLRGPLLGCSEDQLMRLAIGRTGTLWQSLANQGKKDPALAAVNGYLATCLAEADTMTAYAMLARVLSEPCPADSVSGRRALLTRLGPDALDPIDELLNAAQQFGQRHAPSLQAFLHWLKSTEAEIKREMDPGAGQVRIATVHGAKGLEAPIIFLPDTVSVPGKRDLPKILWHPDGVPFYVPREPANALLRGLRETARQKQLEEYRRLLYVAMTRAADRLIVCGWEMQRQDSFADSWYYLITKALKPLHEPSAVQSLSQPEPVVAFADPEFPVSETVVPLAVKAHLTAASLPTWAHRAPEPEPKPPRPLTPSHPEEEEPPSITPHDERFARGTIIHRLLQSLPDLDPARQEEAAARFLASPHSALSSSQQEEILHEVFTLLRHPEFASLFGPTSRAEVPLTAVVNGRVISGQVDRLCVLENEVWIVDYKTNRQPPLTMKDVPQIYVNQLGAYGAVLRTIYPAKTIRTCLLWTCGPKLIEIPCAQMNPA